MTDRERGNYLFVRSFILLAGPTSLFYPFSTPDPSVLGSRKDPLRSFSLSSALSRSGRPRWGVGSGTCPWTGELLWEWTLPYTGNATPSTFEAEGRQFVVIAAGGGRAGDAPTGGIYVAFEPMERGASGSRMARPVIATGIEPWERNRSWKPRSPSRPSCSRRISRMRCDPTK